MLFAMLFATYTFFGLVMSQSIWYRAISKSICLICTILRTNLYLYGPCLRLRLVGVPGNVDAALPRIISLFVVWLALKQNNPKKGQQETQTSSCLFLARLLLSFGWLLLFFFFLSFFLFLVLLALSFLGDTVRTMVFCVGFLLWLALRAMFGGGKFKFHFHGCFFGFVCFGFFGGFRVVFRTKAGFSLIELLWCLALCWKRKRKKRSRRRKNKKKTKKQKKKKTCSLNRNHTRTATKTETKRKSPSEPDTLHLSQLHSPTPLCSHS